jgi:hypothetical protein
VAQSWRTTVSVSRPEHASKLRAEAKHTYPRSSTHLAAVSGRHAIFLLAAVAVVGLALGAVKYRGAALGAASVLFAGILIGHYGQRIDQVTLAS